MIRRPFYQVPSQAYLFQAADTEVRPDLEEAVRQWCAFELIRTYGIAIDRLFFEHPVRVGSKRYRIDILIHRHGLPWAVVECKKQSFTKHEEALEQARSYAIAESINVDYVIYTNGEEWRVEHRVSGDWIGISDLPTQSVAHAGSDILPLLWAYQSLAAVLHKLDAELSGSEASQFLSVLQRFFNSKNLLLSFSNEDLVAGMDNLLRAVFSPDLHIDYRYGKLSEAIQFFERSRSEAGLVGEIFAKGNSDFFHEDLRALATTFSSQAEYELDLSSESKQLMLLAASIAHFGGNKATQNAKLPPIPKELILNLKAYLNQVCIAHLDLSLPDHNDSIGWGDMHQLTSSAWDQAIEKDPTFFQMFLDWIKLR